MATIREVAASSGVSVASVSRVLNGHTQVSPKLRETVLKACKGLNYTINPQLQDAILRGKSGAARNLGLVLADTTLEDPSCNSWVDAIVDECIRRSYQVTILKVASTAQSIYDLPAALRDRRCDGLLITGELSASLMELLRALEVPGVVLGIYASHLLTGFGNVVIHIPQIIEELLDRLRAAGAGRIAFVNENPRNYSNRTFYESFLQYFEPRKLPLYPELVYFGEGPMSGMLRQMKPLFLRRELPFDGILAIEERTAREMEKLDFMHAELFGMPRTPIATVHQSYHSELADVLLFAEGYARYGALAQAIVSLVSEEISQQNGGEHKTILI